MKQLAAKSDVIIENFKPGSKADGGEFGVERC